MENATKALLIAGGMLIVLLVITLLVMFKGQLASYMEEKHNEKIVEQAVEFNNKFANYQGNELRGNELISVMNRIIDYNNLEAQEYGYDKISISVDVANSKDFWQVIKYRAEDESIFSLTGNVIRNGSNDANIRNLTGISAKLINDSGIPRISDTKLQRLSANISYIFDESSQTSKIFRAQKLTDILGYRVDESGYTINKNGTRQSIDGADIYILDKVKSATSKYYQLTQFKRAMFTCTSVGYNTKDNGRINSMTFKIQTDTTGKIIFN